MRVIPARDLKAGQAFRKPGQRKWRIAALVEPLDKDLNEGWPGILVHLNDCSGLVYGEDDDLELPTEPGTLDHDGFIKLRGRRRQRRVYR